MSTLPHADTIIRAGILVTQDADRRVIEDAGIAISGGDIVAVDHWSAISDAFAPNMDAALTPREALQPQQAGAPRVIDLSRHMVLPGLINCHTHAAMTAFRGLADDQPLMVWLQEHIWPMEKGLTPQLVHAGSIVACAEMLRTGTTCFADMYMLESETARAARQMGIRAMLGEGILGFPTRSYDTPQQAIELTAALRDAVADTDTIRVCMPPHGVYTTSEDILKDTFRAAEDMDMPWMIHLSESAAECAQSLEMYGKRPVAVADDAGCLSPRSVLVHCVDLTDGEIERIAASGASVAHNPRSNMKLASGIARVRDLLAAGVNVCLGTDGAASNNSLNLFREMTACAMLGKVSSGDPTAVPAAAVLDAATVNGARALRWDGLGSIREGNIADIVALSLDEPALCPVYNPISHAVYAAGGHDVALTMVGGRVLYADGTFANITTEELRANARRLSEWVDTARSGKPHSGA